MAGIYIHIPFCKKACHYCDFHFSTSLKYKNELIQNLLNEIRIRQSYLNNEPIDSIYFGGGTPSLLNQFELELIMTRIHETFQVNANIEITLEANPDDINKEKLLAFTSVGINRLSIGIQSFYDEDLAYMNRSHTASQAEQCIQLAREHGFENFSIDLIFGFPLLTQQKWERNIETALKYKVPHLSCYAMTIEPKTALASFIKSKKELPINHEESANQFEYLMKQLHQNNYIHYEISNYALENCRAIHNSNYWKGVSYLGIGPSAHSYNGISRQWNVSNNAKYIQALQKNELPFEIETLTSSQKLNERIMTSLRTIEGFDTSIVNSFLKGDEIEEWNRTVAKYVHEEMLIVENHSIKLSSKGKLFADYLAGELFV